MPPVSALERRGIDYLEQRVRDHQNVADYVCVRYEKLLNSARRAIEEEDLISLELFLSKHQ